LKECSLDTPSFLLLLLLWTQTVRQEHLIQEEDCEVTSTPTTTQDTTNNGDNAVDDNDDNDPSLDDSFSNNGFLQLPATATTTTSATTTNHNHKQVPNCCAICLGDYAVGNVVIWSSNPKCQHAFHDDCILEWLLKMQPATPCPCCRQEFTDLEDFRRTKKVIWTGTNAFHLQSIGL
jgi:hypothetical protein